MIVKIRNDRMESYTAAWWSQDNVKQYDVREIILVDDSTCEESKKLFTAQPRPDWVTRDFIKENPDMKTGFCGVLITINPYVSGNPGELECGSTYLAPAGGVFIMNDEGKTIEKF